MGTYTKHNGNQVDTADMPTKYLQNALAVAEDEENEDNINALTKELASREDNNETLTN